MTSNLSSSRDALPNEFTLAMGQLIKQAREDMGWSQATLAETIDHRRASISEIENGKMVPDVVTLVLLAQVFEKPVVHFIPQQWRNEIAEGTLTAEEQELLSQFRHIGDDEHRRIAINQVRALAEFEDRSQPPEVPSKSEQEL